jgi:hypothetical protein
MQLSRVLSASAATLFPRNMHGQKANALGLRFETGRISIALFETD